MRYLHIFFTNKTFIDNPQCVTLKLQQTNHDHASAKLLRISCNDNLKKN